MRQDVEGQQLLFHTGKRKRRNKLLSHIGLLLVLLSLFGLGLSIFLSLLQNGSATTKIVPAHPPSRIKPISSLPCFSVNPETLTYYLEFGSPSGPQAVVLANCSSQATSWSTIVDTSWLHVSPRRGDLSGGAVQNVTIIASPSADLGFVSFFGQATFLASSGVKAVLQVEVIILGAQPLTPTPDVMKDKLVSHTSIPHLTIAATWPYLTKDQSINITVSLIILGNPLPGSLPSVTPKNASTNSIAPMSSSSTLLKDVYGPEYELVSVIAQLDGTAFDISSSVPQSPDQKVINFHWNILPKIAGPQSLEVSIGGQWKSPEGELVTSYFLQGDLVVSVNDSPLPFITLGQITLGELVLGFLGSILNIPWIVDYIQKRREKKEEKQTASSTSMPKASSKQPGKQRRRKKRRQSH